MGTRSIERQIAKARMKVVGVDRVNRRMGASNSEGMKNWRLALMDENAHRKQIAYGMKAKRKLKRVGV